MLLQQRDWDLSLRGRETTRIICALPDHSTHTEGTGLGSQREFNFINQGLCAPLEFHLRSTTSRAPFKKLPPRSHLDGVGWTVLTPALTVCQDSVM